MDRINNTQQKNAHARRLFDGIASNYEGPARVFSLLQYSRWHRFLVSRLRLTPQTSVLDVCTGTGLVAGHIARRWRCHVVGVDLSGSMLKQARLNLQGADISPETSLVKGRAENLPFADRSFDVVVFTFLLRYVEDPQATLRELARVLRPGGQMASLEFFVPQNPVLHRLWLLHTRLVLPLGTRFLSPGWRDIGSFLGPSISTFYQKHPLKELVQMWEEADVVAVQTQMLSLGGAVVMWGQKEADGEN